MTRPGVECSPPPGPPPGQAEALSRHMRETSSASRSWYLRMWVNGGFRITARLLALFREPAAEGGRNEIEQVADDDAAHVHTRQRRRPRLLHEARFVHRVQDGPDHDEDDGDRDAVDEARPVRDSTGAEP